jgi:hypothetical protein
VGQIEVGVGVGESGDENGVRNIDSVSGCGDGVSDHLIQPTRGEHMPIFAGREEHGGRFIDQKPGVREGCRGEEDGARDVGHAETVVSKS